MALDQARWDDLRDHAMSGGSYVYGSRMPGEVAGGRPNNVARKALRTWLAEAQGGLCPVRRGDEAPHALVSYEYNHVHAQGKNHKGYVGGNIMAGCGACNDVCAETYGERKADGSLLNGGSIPLAALHADLIVRDLPGITAMLKSL